MKSEPLDCSIAAFDPSLSCNFDQYSIGQGLNNVIDISSGEANKHDNTCIKILN